MCEAEGIRIPAIGEAKNALLCGHDVDLYRGDDPAADGRALGGVLVEPARPELTRQGLVVGGGGSLDDEIEHRQWDEASELRGR